MTKSKIKLSNTPGYKWESACNRINVQTRTILCSLSFFSTVVV